MLRKAVEETGIVRRPMPSRVHDAARRPKRVWSINGDFLALQPNGVARYAREVTLALDTLILERHPLTDRLEIDLLAPRPATEPLPLRSIPVRLVPEFDKPRLPQVWVQAQLPGHVRGGLLSFCNLAPVAVTRQIVCIHDLHTRLMPESYGRLFRWAHRAILPALGKRVAFITTVSGLSRDHLVRFGVAPWHKIAVTYNGSDHALRWDAARSNLKVASGRPYALCLGRDQKYKNAELMVRLAAKLDAMGLDLWMAGAVDEGLVRRHAAEVPNNLRLLGRISDDDFKRALSGALCFLFPSRIEGFGLPAVEAMTAGCPVVASTSPCLPEICGDAALYANPDDLDAWAGHIRQLQDDAPTRSRLVEAGFQKAQRYSWRSVAETYLELMIKVDLAGVR
ncbi:glycosyltransferase family 1 protein [Aurantimonas sp. A2-1-M11]|uniref:glycosyltransferase family 4 protein n=1 Tax=Aurantimonas sp. A2-1-M11 TaxID=3113712 RepID=UPI002F9479E7